MDMVERVGRAHADFAGCKYEPDKSFWDGTARVAIEAMREPTNVMLKASCGAMSDAKRPTPDRVSSKEKHRIRYRAMIDAALKVPAPSTAS